MIPKKEFSSLKNKLNSDRKNRLIEFDSITRETNNGDTYLCVTCSSTTDANNIQSEYKNELDDVYTYITFDGIKNPATKNTYVYFIIRNYTQ